MLRIFAWLACVAAIGLADYSFLQSDLGQTIMSGEATCKQYGIAFLVTAPLSIFCIILGGLAGRISYTLTVIGFISTLVAWVVLVGLKITGHTFTRCLDLFLFINGAIGKSLFWGLLFTK
jgi:hypothetical protein